MSALDAWVFVAATAGVLWVFWALLMFTLTQLELARRRTSRYASAGRSSGEAVSPDGERGD